MSNLQMHTLIPFVFIKFYLYTNIRRSTLINQFFQEDLCTDDELEDIPMSTSIDALAHKDSCHHYLGKMDILCPYCSALHWMDEKLTKSSMKHPLFGTCSLEGKIRLPLFITPPPPL